MTLRVLVSGANGFVGQAVCARAVCRSLSVKGGLRKLGKSPTSFEPVIVGEIDGETDWLIALRDVDVVIHLAARVHVMHDDAANPLDEFRKVNVAGTEQLARSAAASGVKRLVYVSSIKVNGEGTLSLSPSDGTASHSTRPPKDGDQVHPQGVRRGCKGPKPQQHTQAGCPARGRGERDIFTESDIPAPQDSYGISKWEAEQALHRVAAETGLEIVIIRPPLVYGPGVKGNFAQMLKVLAKGIPLPLASVRNLRSLVYVENLADALIVCATHPDAAGQTYLISDGEDISTSGLLRQLGDAMGHPARLFPCPPVLLKLAGQLSGKADQIERLLGSLRVDSSKIRCELNWTPPYTLQQGLQRTATEYQNARGR